MSRQKFLIKTISAVVLGMGSAAVHAAGFQLLEQNASGLGNAYAGSAAVAENASTIFFNPAGMTYLPGINVSGGVNLIKPSFKFRNNGDSRGPFGSIPTGGNGGDAGNLGVVPNAYVSWQLNEKWFTGLGIGAPFGLMTEYDNNWIGQYQSTKFDIKTININPSIAYKVNNAFSVGAGVNWQYIDATYTKQAVLSPTTSGNAKLNLDNDAWGWNVGVMLQPSDDTRFGLAYRSKIKHNATGDTTISGLPGGATLNYDAKASVELPDTLILSGLHKLNDKWELLGDVSWTGWSSIQELRIVNAGGPTDELPLKFRDSWRVAVGANYQFAPLWKWKFGVAFDQSPVHKAEDRPASLPDTDRWWFSTGVQYQATKNTTIDVGYTYLYLRNTSIDTTSGNALTKGRLAGTYNSQGNILGVQVSARF